jgi:hypothetical protein
MPGEPFLLPVVRVPDRSAMVGRPLRPLVRVPGQLDRPAFQATAQAVESVRFRPFRRQMERRPSQTTPDSVVVRRYERWAFQAAAGDAGTGR